MLDGTTRTCTYDGNGKLLNTRWVGQGPPGPITANFYYDGAGNTTSVTGTEFGAWTMSYDDESRPLTITSPSATDSFVWNALGQRMRVTLNGTVYRYVYAGNRVLEETNDAGGLVARYSLESGSYYAPWVATYLAGVGARFPLMDAVGTTRRLVTSGNTHWDRYELDAFGADRGSWTNYHNPYRFGGAWGYTTGSSGLLQLGARFYWPEIGRFITQDPIGDGMNWYGYTGNNPLRWVDPSGLVDIVPVLIEADIATPWGGIDASVGIVIDTHNLWHSGVFSSGGPSYGLNAGLGYGVGIYREVEGLATNYDLNAGRRSVSLSFTPRPGEPAGLSNLNGGAVTRGPGYGVSRSLTQTDTFTAESIWDRLKRAGRWLRNYVWPC